MLGLTVPFTSLVEKCWAQTIFLESNQLLFIFLHLIFNLQGHILSPGGVALTIYGTHQKVNYEVQPTKNVQKIFMKVRKCQKATKYVV